MSKQNEITTNDCPVCGEPSVSIDLFAQVPAINVNGVWSPDDVIDHYIEYGNISCGNCNWTAGDAVAIL